MVAQDWNHPDADDAHLDVLSQHNERSLHTALMDYTDDTNLPTGVIKADVDDSDRLKRFNGTSWDNLQFIQDLIDHIASTTLHSGIPPGTFIHFGGSAAPTGYLLCDGTAISRTTYANLFTAIGTLYGAGDGSTTFNLPDGQGRIVISKKASVGAIDTVGKVAGSWDHTHSTPNHTHTIPTHTHTLSAHTHAVGNHSHTISSHTHSLPAHYHNVGGAGATLAISGAGGAHNHDVLTRTAAGAGGNRVAEGNGGSPNTLTGTGTIASSGSAHTHPHSDFAGLIGNVTGGVDGDSPSNVTGGTSGLATDASSGVVTGAPSSDVTGASGTLTSNSGEGSGTSGTGNPPVIVGLLCIKI